jgi:hypothetical protein
MTDGASQKKDPYPKMEPEVGVIIPLNYGRFTADSIAESSIFYRRKKGSCQVTFLLTTFLATEDLRDKCPLPDLSESGKEALVQSPRSNPSVQRALVGASSAR